MQGITSRSTVFLARREAFGYTGNHDAEMAPELPGGRAIGLAQILLRRLLLDAALDGTHCGGKFWNPFSNLLRGARKVVIKPNWVYHENRSGHGMDCLVTHDTVIAAILNYIIAASPSRIVVGDAPVQGCDFQALCRNSGVDDLVAQFESCGFLSVNDFRMTKRAGDQFAAKSLTSQRSRDQYVEFDLGASSWLDPISSADVEFRVTMYDPEAVKNAHAPARHRYLVAREIIEADLVINVPKLKTHKKAGITGTLKNAVGINGLKDYLPHHRKGSPEKGGDCYARGSVFKTFGEACLDTANRPRQMGWITALLGRAARASTRLDAMCGGDRNMEGGWYGNDTIWRTVLDLQRILKFGKPDGTIASAPQREVIHITDAIVAGQGDGPMYPSPVPLGVMTMAADPAAAEWVHALLMSFDPHKIPLVRHALDAAGLNPSDLRIVWEGRTLTCEQLSSMDWPKFEAPSGWAGHCELAQVEVEQLC